MDDDHGALPRWLWLWIPVLYLPFESLVRALDSEGTVYGPVFLNEDGFVEIATALLLVPAAYLGIRRAVRLRRGGRPLASALLLLFGLGCLFLLGEEISYGQHLFGWDSPEYFDEQNVQQETNIHNLEFVDRNLMKWLFLGGMLVVGIVLPLVFRWGGVPRWLARSPLGPALVGGAVCLPTAAMAIAMHLLVKVMHWRFDFEFHDRGFIDMRETTELYIAYFLLLYALALVRGLDASGRRDGTRPGGGALSPRR